MCEKRLTPKQERFVEEYLVDLNATAAAKRAGYSEKTANPCAGRLLLNVSIQNAIAERRAAQTERTNLTADDVIRGLQELARRGMSEDAYDPKTALKAYELLGKHLGIFSDKVTLTGADGAPLIPETQTIRVHFDAPPEPNDGN